MPIAGSGITALQRLCIVMLCIIVLSVAVVILCSLLTAHCSFLYTLCSVYIAIYSPCTASLQVPYLPFPIVSFLSLLSEDSPSFTSAVSHPIQLPLLQNFS